eukprot:XP_028344264.1 uncharacterized protein LOC114486141 isoform X1 [Physeter catodon]
MSFREKIKQRRLKGEAEEAVYEAFGKRKQEFKEGKKIVYDTAVCENLARKIQTACDPAPLEPCPVEFPPDACLTPEQQAKVSETPPSPPPPPQTATRYEWTSKPITFRHNRSSPEVVERAKQLVNELHVSRQVALRLALLYEYDDLESGRRILQIYRRAMEDMKQGFRCLKINQKSLKLSGKIISLNVPKEYLRIRSDRKVFSFGGVDLDFRVIEDVFPGTSASTEFNAVNKRLKTVGQRFQEDRCCVIKTIFRTYSMIFAKSQDTRDLCAVVDLFKGIHGPAVWKGDAASAGAIFRMESNLEPVYNLR